MTIRRALVAAATVAAVGLAPAVANAAGGVDLRLNQGAKWPDRELVVSLPSRQSLTNDQVLVRENGAPVDSAQVTPEATNRKRGVILAIDASLTMTGAPIREAMAAARAFARNRSENTPLGVVFFSGEPHVALAPTTDPLSIRTTLAVGPGLTRGTRIFDAAAAGIRALRAAGLTSGAIVVLSDGAEAEHGSAIAPGALAALARRSNVRIFSVGLDSHSFNSVSLRTIASSTGGRYGQAARPKDLPPLFAAIGQRLSSEYLVSYRSTEPAGAPVLVEARINGFAGATSVGYRAPALSFAAAGAGHPNPSNGLDGTRVLMLGIAFFVAMALVLYLLLRPKRRSLVSRVAEFAGTPGLVAPTLGDVRKRPQRKPSDRWQRYADRVELADIGISPSALALSTALGTLALAWYLGFAAGRPPLVIMAVVVPLTVRILVERRVTARRLEFEDQLPDNLQVLASALRAGYSFSAGLASMAEDAPEPSRTELHRASTDEQLGVDVSDALAVVAQRMASPEIEYVGIVARMQREAGGNTAEVLDQVIETIRARQQLKRMVRALTAQGRLGGAIISIMPIVVSVGMAILHPGYFDPMLHSSIGVILLFAGTAMLATGWMIIRKIVNVEP